MTLVVKYGGATLGAFLDRPGDDVVVVHGGGPQITAALAAEGVPTAFVNGRRVTTPEAMAVVHRVLAEVNAEVVALVGPRAAGVPGEDVLTATPLDPALGLVGDVTAVDAAPLRALLDRGSVPVVATVARGAAGEVYNVNADTAAAAIAVALAAEQVVFLTDVDGLYADYPDPASLVSEITADDLDDLLPTLTEGMVPKAEACVRAVRGGVGSARVGRALLGGTVVTP